MLDTQQLISDVSGAGNNWAHGNHIYGPQYRDQARCWLRCLGCQAVYSHACCLTFPTLLACAPRSATSVAPPWPVPSISFALQPLLHPWRPHILILLLPTPALQILEKIQRTVEACDSLQSFLLLHSLGGGTGSGVGTYILELLAVREGPRHLGSLLVF